MKDYVLELVKSQEDSNTKLNLMREYLQAYTLRILHDTGFFRSNAFLRGTALRFLYNLPRYSEDLDFSLVEGKQGFVFQELLKKLKEEFTLAGYQLTISYNDKKTVQHAFLRFQELLYLAGLSPRSEQKISIKIKIDTNPPKGYVLKTDIVNKYFPIAFLSYDVPPLFAGKLTALFCRRYTKGRDFFDAAWYLSKWKDLVPNMELLHNGLHQMGKIIKPHTWREKLHDVIKKTDWKNVREDVESFLENRGDLENFSKENVLSLFLSSRETKF